MQTFERNISHAFGKAGTAWLKQIPEIVDALQKEWHLSEIRPIDTMTYHFVAKAKA